MQLLGTARPCQTERSVDIPNAKYLFPACRVGKVPIFDKSEMQSLSDFQQLHEWTMPSTGYGILLLTSSRMRVYRRPLRQSHLGWVLILSCILCTKDDKGPTMTNPIMIRKGCMQQNKFYTYGIQYVQYGWAAAGYLQQPCRVRSEYPWLCGLHTRGKLVAWR